MRHQPPDIRTGFTRKVALGNLDMYITVNFYADGELAQKPCEVFCVVGKNGGTVGGLMDVWMITLSDSFKRGVPWEELEHKFLHQKFEPSDSDNPSIAHLAAKTIGGIINHAKDVWNDKISG